VEHAKYFGFTLSGDGRCLLKDFVVTHNSYDRCPLYRLCRIEDVRKHAIMTNPSLASASHDPFVAGASTGVVGAGGRTLAAASTPNSPSTGPLPAIDKLDSTSGSFVTPNTQSRRIHDRRERDRLKAASPLVFASTPFNSSDVGLLTSGPLTPLTIARGTPFFVSKLVEHYLSLDPHAEGLLYWSDVTLLHALVARLIALGQTHVAFLVVQKALGYDSPWQHDLKLKYYRVLALRHTQKADEFMHELKVTIKTHNNPAQIPIELRAAVLSLSGRMLKDKYFDSIRNNDPQSSFAHESAREYFFSYELQNSSFPAINAATMLLLSKQKERARALAKFSVRLVADELLARSRQQGNLSSEADRSVAAHAQDGGAHLNVPDDETEKVLGDGTVLDDKATREEQERAARGEVAGKTSEKAPGEGAKGGPVGEEYCQTHTQHQQQRQQQQQSTKRDATVGAGQCDMLTSSFVLSSGVLSPRLASVEGCTLLWVRRISCWRSLISASVGISMHSRRLRVTWGPFRRCIVTFYSCRVA
jgi:hypothetical protein